MFTAKSQATSKPHKPRKTGPVTFETVRQLALSFPGVEDGTCYGSPALKVHGKLLACMAVHRSAESNSLAVNQISFDERDAMVTEDPKTFYFTDHYLNYPVILVRLSEVRRETLRALIETAWRRSAPRRLLTAFDRKLPR